MEEAVKDMLELGMIERPESPWSFPIIVADKELRHRLFCVNFRKLNAITKSLSVPLSLIDDILALP